MTPVTYRGDVGNWKLDSSASSIRSLRMDTWANNTALIEFYERRGFRLLGHARIGVDPRLASHYHRNEFALLERSCARP